MIIQSIKSNYFSQKNSTVYYHFHNKQCLCTLIYIIFMHKIVKQSIRNENLVFHLSFGQYRPWPYLLLNRF